MRFHGSESRRVDVRSGVVPARQVRTAVDVEPRHGRLEREEERRIADPRRPARELEARKPLLEDRGAEERLAPLEAQVERVVAQVLRQEGPRQDLPRRCERERSLEVLEILLVGVVADRDDAPETPGQIVGDVVEPDLPPVLRSLREDAGRSVGQGARRSRRRRLRERDADGRVRVVNRVRLKDAGRFRGRRPSELLAHPDRAARVEVQVRRQIRRPAGDPVVRQAEVGPAARS